MLAGQNLLILLAIAFFIFGAKKLPEIGSGMGKAIRSFKNAVNGVERETLDVPPEKPKVELLENPRVESKDSSLPKSG